MPNDYSVLFDEAEEEIKKFIVTFSPEPIRMLAFKGGGAKGSGYPGVTKALEELMLLSQIESVGGSSVGALTALSMALGMTADETEKFVNEENFLSYLDVSAKDNIKYRGICDGNVLYKKLQDVIASQIKRRQMEALTTLAEKIKKVPQGDVEEIQMILDLANKINEINMHKITFADLALLKNALPENKVKDLLITGTKLTGEDPGLRIFSHETTPNMEIALACRISVSLPLVFKAVELYGDLYGDGGIGDNLPIQWLEALSNKNNVDFLNHEERRHATLSFMLGEQDEKILHNDFEPYQLGLLGSLKKYVLQAICKVNYVSNMAQLREALRDHYAQHTIVLPIHEVKTLSFNINTEKKKMLQEEARETVENYLGHRKSRIESYTDYLSFALSIRYGALTEGLIHSVAEQSVEEDDVVTNKEIGSIIKDIRQNEADFMKMIVEEIEELNLHFERLTIFNKALNFPTSNKAGKKALQHCVDEESNLIQESLQALKEGIDDHLNHYAHRGIVLSEKHRQIIYSRLEMACGKHAYLLAENLINYKKAQQHSHDPHFFVEGNDFIEEITFNKVKDDIMTDLKVSKGKHFQWNENIDLLTRAERKIKNARSYEGIEKALETVKEGYKPRIFLYLNTLIQGLTARPASIATQKVIESHLENVRIAKEISVR